VSFQTEGHREPALASDQHIWSTVPAIKSFLDRVSHGATVRVFSKPRARDTQCP